MADGATATGSFTYDADTNAFSQIDVTTSGGTVLPGSHYVATAPAAGVVSDGTRAILVTSASLPNFNGTPPALVNAVAGYNAKADNGTIEKRTTAPSPSGEKAMFCTATSS